MSKSHYRVAICGAGIGGLSLAVTIGKFSDMPIDLYEAGSEITTVGAGISVWRRTWQVMQRLGLDAELAKKAIKPPREMDSPGFVFRRSDQHEEGFVFYRQVLPYGGITLHRADLVDVFKQALPPTCAVHLFKRLTKYTCEEGAGPIVLHFSDGTTSEADVLVGADGVKSATRATMYDLIAVNLGDPAYGRFKTPKWSGTLGYRYLVPVETLRQLDPQHSAISNAMVYCGREKHVVSYPVSHGRLINVIAFYTVPGGEGTRFQEKWVVDVPKQDVIDCYKDWEPEVLTLLKCIEKPSRWAIHVMDSPPFCISGHVAIMGDAAHAMTTHFGAGAGQAIEDAYILGRLLTHNLTRVNTIPQALRVYQEIRLPFANNVVRQARLTGLMYEFSAPGYYDGKDRSCEKEELEQLSGAIKQQWAWNTKGGSNEDWEWAERRLKEVALALKSYRL